MRRVVVTGLGVVAPAGIGVDAFWKQITHGVSAVGRITKFDPAGLPSQIAAEVNGFDPEAYLPRRDVVRTDTGEGLGKLRYDEATAEFSL